MELERRVGSDLLAQLLAGDEPRCFWTPARTFENEAFRTLETDRTPVIGAARSVFAGERQARAYERGGYVWALTRIVHDDVAGVLINGLAGTAFHDERLAALPSILQFHAGRMPNAANLHRLMELVVRADGKLFSAALLLASEKGPFLVLHDCGPATQGMRSWTRWPLERLFAKRRAATITNPVTNEKALAIPFHVPPAERYVLIFVLRAEELSKNDRDFLSVLQCVAAVVPQSAFEWRTRVYDRIEAPVVPSAPRLFYYGHPKLRERIEKMIARRGWRLESSSSYKEAMSAMRSDLQMVLIDGAALSGRPPTMLRWLRRTAPNTPVLYFGEILDDETEILVDGYVDPESSDAELFGAIKSIVRELPRRRRDHLEALVGRLSPVLLSATSYGQLATMTARCLVPHFAEWAVVHLFDASGELYRAEFPQRAEPVMREVPLTFLSGYAIMKTRVDEQFFADLCEEQSVYDALQALHPRSGAAIPLVHGGTLIGSLVVLTIKRDLEESDFQGLALFAEAASEAFMSLQLRADQAADSNDAWTRVSMGLYHVDVYRPHADRSLTFRVTPLDGRCIRIEATRAGGGHLLATLDVKGHRLAYETWRFPSPFYVPATGPVSLTEQDVSEHSTGTITLDQPAIALIYDLALTQAIDTATLVEIFQSGLRDGQTNPASLLGDIGSNRFPFVAISFR